MLYTYDIYAAMQRLGVTQLREEQEKRLCFILDDRDSFIRLRTGGGKSLLYQLPAPLDAPGELTLVFSPLLALQHDQVQSLQKKDIRAALLNSNLDRSHCAETLRDFTQNSDPQAAARAAKCLDALQEGHPPPQRPLAAHRQVLPLTVSNGGSVDTIYLYTRATPHN